MYIITLPNRRQVTIPTYCESWRTLKTLAPSDRVAGWDYEAVRADVILHEIRRGVHDRINQRGGVVLRDASEGRVLRVLRRRVVHDCKWCGSPLGRYEPDHARFCDSSCRSSYYN